jgi:predicted RND superfamily exporter protein
MQFKPLNGLGYFVVVGWLLCGFYAVILFIQAVMILFQMWRKSPVVNMKTEHGFKGLLEGV